MTYSQINHAKAWGFSRRSQLEQEGKDVFEYDIYNCPEKLKGQLKIGDFS
jgi:hypothetical protein